MSLFKNKDVLKWHPIDLFLKMDTEFGDEQWLDWEVDTLLPTVYDEVFTNTDSTVLDKLMAIQAVGTNSNLVVSDAVAFENVVNAFCNNPCVIDCVQPPEIEEIFYAVKQILKIIAHVHSIEESDIEFTGEVPGYVAAAAAYTGWVVLPKPLWFAQKQLLSLTHLEPGTQKYKDNAAYLKAGEAAINTLDLGDFTDLDALLGESFSSMFIGRIVGAYLYDPTVIEGV
jgi:hypothetical protein